MTDEPVPTGLRLLIYVQQGNNPTWVAAVANTNVSYPFVGNAVPDQEAAVQQMAAAMQEGQQALLAGLPDCLQLGDTPVAQVAQQLYQTTSSLIEQGDEIFVADEGASLWDELEAAGEALAACF